MRTQTVYVAVDGRQFNDSKQCKDHEERLFNAWMKENLVYDAFIKAGDVQDSPRRRAVIRDFWEFNYGK